MILFSVGIILFCLGFHLGAKLREKTIRRKYELLRRV